MCFMTFTGEKSGDIFDGFGDGYDGNAGDGGVNDKENERINSRAITFGSVTIWPEMERVIGGGSGEILQFMNWKSSRQFLELIAFFSSFARRGLWASEKPTDEWSERINGGTCEQLVKELGRFVKTKSRKLFRPDAAVLVGKCTIWTKSCETIKSLRESGIPFGILKSEDQVAFGKLKSPNM
uniref:Uncharacterized protein n=1 Tax=Caenorhabditis japonica TaxID=281687 RepID=A0A8R1EJE7_CAEJA